LSEPLTAAEKLATFVAGLVVTAGVGVGVAAGVAVGVGVGVGVGDGFTTVTVPVIPKEQCALQ
jgi:hypothetical protein